MESKKGRETLTDLEITRLCFTSRFWVWLGHSSNIAADARTWNHMFARNPPHLVQTLVATIHFMGEWFTDFLFIHGFLPQQEGSFSPCTYIIRAKLKVTHLRWRTPICSFLRLSAKIFGFLRISAVSCNRQSLAFTECGQLSQSIPQFHMGVERMLHERTPIARFETQRKEHRAYEDQFLRFGGEIWPPTNANDSNRSKSSR